MRNIRSLDELIAKKAVEFASQIKVAAGMATKEEEIRIEAERQLAFIEKEADVKLHGRHEFTVASGRVDSVYDRVIIEYKNPSDPGARIGPKAESPGSKKVVAQIKKRFYDMRTEHGQPLNTLFGVGLDGNYFIFVRFRDDKWQVQDPVEVNRHSAERFLWALFNLGQKGKPFSPDYLAGDFGAEAKLAQDGVRTLYEAICETESPKARTFFSQWKILFGEVCGYNVESTSDKLKKLADSYQVARKGLQPAELLFALHTYYALFMKLLANEMVAFFHRLTSPLESLMRAGTSANLRRELEKIESGGVFQHFNITNFLEGDLFAWYLPVWSESIEKLVRDMVSRLDGYNPGTLSEDRAVSRDLLKKLYHQLFPRSVRHDLGEYYTPDWLAELVLDELGYEADPDKRLLDPACGSGTFLAVAINRIRHWYEANREVCRYDEAELCRKILANVVGFDLNPLAVMAARTNYLIAIRGLLSYAGQVELPVYLCDSILTPSAYGEPNQKEILGRPMQLQTAAKPAPFFIPREVTADRGVLARYSNLLATLSPVRSGYTAQEFLDRLADEGLPREERDDHLRLFEELRELDRNQKNGVWAWIIKNAFAPLFVQRVDYVAGNPPWVNWESLPDGYRDTLKPIWQRYGLFTLSGAAGRLGGGKKDLSMLFVYAAVDDYLKEGGRLGFVITQTVFKTKGAGDGFRQLEYKSNGGKVVIKPLAVHDLSAMQVFEGATNRTAVFVCRRQSRPFAYPVPYVQWRGPSRIRQDETLLKVREATQQVKLGAVPVEREKATSPWLTAPKDALAGIEKVIGKSDYKAYEGVNTGGLNGCYWIRILKELPGGNLLIENLHDVGKIKVEKVQAAIEPDLVYPLLRGRDVSRWRAEPSAYIILAQDPETRRGIPESTMKRIYPKTYSYLKQFETQLRKRASSSVRRLMDTGPFYSMFAVGPHTLSPWKVVWTGQVATALKCAVVEKDHRGRIILNDQTVYQVPFASSTEAHFFAGILNCSLVRAFYHFLAYKHASMDFIQGLRLPKYDSENPAHSRLAELSRECHRISTDEGTPGLIDLESEADEIVAKLWKFSKAELGAVRDAIAGTAQPTRGRRQRRSEAVE
jgi:hypothetical protein